MVVQEVHISSVRRERFFHHLSSHIACHHFCLDFCRNYKNGYVWNDLSENDVIYPSDGVEYVLKGSEIFPGCSSGTSRHHLPLSTRSSATMCVFLVVRVSGAFFSSGS
jgi:hypothetical protein